MSPAWAFARSEIRARWPALVALGLVAGLVGAVALGSAIGARRTATAYDRLVVASDLPDAIVQLIEPAPGTVEAVLALPEIERSLVSLFAVGIDEGAADLLLLPMQAGPDGLLDLTVVRGRPADPSAPDEAVIGERFAAELGVDLEDQILFRALTQDEFGSLLRDQGAFEATGPGQDLRIVGIARSPTDSVLDGYPTLFGTPAFHHAFVDDLPDSRQVWVHLREGSSTGDLRVAASSLPGTAGTDRLQAVDVIDLRGARGTIDDAAGVLVVGLVLTASVALAVGTVVVGQAMGRHVQASAGSRQQLRALGLDRPAVTAATVMAGSVTVVVATAIGVAGAALSSRWMPLGAAGRAEPSPGLRIEPLYLGTGAVVMVVALALGWSAASRWSSSRGDRAPRSGRGLLPGAFARLTSWGIGVPTSTGAAMAIGPDVRRSQPGRVATLGAFVGIAGLGASVVFGASLDGLSSAPERWGMPADHVIEIPDPVRAELMRTLDGAPEVAAYAEVRGGTVEVEGRPVVAYGFESRKGGVEPTVLEGRSPSRSGEVSLGPDLMDELGVGIGSTVELTVAGETRVATVVGSTLSFGLADRDGRTDALLLAPDVVGWAEFHTALVRFSPGVDSRATARRLYGTLEHGAPPEPASVAHVTALGPLPGLLAVLLGTVGVGAVVHGVLLAIRRRRRDLAVLRALGMTPRQTRRAARSLALSSVVVAVVGGLPLGSILGGVAWRSVAASIDVVSVVSRPWWLLTVLPGAVGVAAITAGASTRRTTTMPPAGILRSE